MRSKLSFHDKQLLIRRTFDRMATGVSLTTVEQSLAEELPAWEAKIVLRQALAYVDVTYGKPVEEALLKTGMLCIIEELHPEVYHHLVELKTKHVRGLLAAEIAKKMALGYSADQVVERLNHPLVDQSTIEIAQDRERRVRQAAAKPTEEEHSVAIVLIIILMIAFVLMIFVISGTKFLLITVLFGTWIAIRIAASQHQ